MHLAKALKSYTSACSFKRLSDSLNPYPKLLHPIYTSRIDYSARILMYTFN